MKQKLTKLEGEIYKSTVIYRDLDNHFSVTNGISSLKNQQVFRRFEFEIFIKHYTQIWATHSFLVHMEYSPRLIKF